PGQFQAEDRTDHGGGQVQPGAGDMHVKRPPEDLESLVEGHIALDCDLVSGYTAFEEVCQLLYVLEFHEGERVRGTVASRHAEPGQPLVGDVLQVGAHLLGGHAGHAVAAQVAGEGQLGGDRLLHHAADLLGQLVVEEAGLFGADGVDDAEGELHVHG